MNTTVVYGLVTISALLATAMRLTRKYIMKYMKNYSIIIIDAVITGIAMILTGLYMGGFDQIKKDLSKLHGTTLLAFLAASACIVISTIIGYTLIIGGMLMLVLPGQGLFTILIGLMLSNYPGKFYIEKKFIAIPNILKTINWLRKKSNKPPLKI